MKRSRKKSSMSGKDSHGTSWLSGWGKDRKKSRRLERKRRERNAEKENLACTCGAESVLGLKQHAADCPMWAYRGFAKGGYLPPRKDSDRIFVRLAEGEGYVTSEEVKARYGDTLKNLNGGGKILIGQPNEDDETCLFFWGSHGCDLPADGHEIHECRVTFYDLDETATLEVCCQYNEADDRVRHNLNDGDDPEWGEWSYYGHGWYMEPRNP